MRESCTTVVQVAASGSPRPRALLLPHYQQSSDQDAEAGAAGIWEQAYPAKDIADPHSSPLPLQPADIQHGKFSQSSEGKAVQGLGRCCESQQYEERYSLHLPSNFSVSW